MQWVPMTSRLISEISYDATQEILFVRLRSGQLRSFHSISPAVFENLKTADSPGFYYSYYIARRGGQKASGRNFMPKFRPLRWFVLAVLACAMVAANATAV